MGRLSDNYALYPVMLDELGVGDSPFRLANAGLSVTRLDHDLPWEERTSARFEAFVSPMQGVPYTYGKGVGARTYYTQREPRVVEMVRHHINAKLGTRLDLCFANRYDNQHQHLGWHADDGPSIDHDHPIVVVSFGAERELWIRAMPHYVEDYGNQVHKLALPNGSVLVMRPGMQSSCQHRIPKHPQPCGPRISLTFRKLL